MSRRRVSAPSVAVFACLAAGLAGCSSDPSADASPEQVQAGDALTVWQD